MKSLISLTLIILIASCNQSPKEISYGHEACSFCKMQIMDNRFASQIVTPKGKAIKFDAIECMINYSKTEDQEGSKYYVSDYSSPGIFVEASDAFFLKSQQVPSPMGANLSAYSQLESAVNAKDSFKGDLYSLHQLKDQKMSGHN